MKKIGKIAGSILKGVVDASTGGMVSTIQNTLKSDDGAPKGKIDWPMIIGYVVTFGVIVLVAYDKLSIDEVKEISKILP